MDPPAGHVTLLLQRMRAGDKSAEAELLRVAYEPLRALASGQLKRHESPLLQPTVLVHELYLRLTGKDDAAALKDRQHFMALAATAMRQIAIDHLRKTRSAKRGGDRARISLSEVDAHEHAPPVDLVALDEALARLEKLDARQARVVELKVFGGLAHTEIAEVLDTSLRTVERAWRGARAWLARELAGVELDEEA